MANIKRESFVRVSEGIKNRVAKKVVGTGMSIGSFYDDAAKEKLERDKIKRVEKDRSIPQVSFLTT